MTKQQSTSEGNDNSHHTGNNRKKHIQEWRHQKDNQLVVMVIAMATVTAIRTQHQWQGQAATSPVALVGNDSKQQAN